MKRIWMSEGTMFTVATVLLIATGGAFILAPAAMFAILMVGRGTVVLVVAVAGIGSAAFVRALLLQRQRYIGQPKQLGEYDADN
jgi:hypothetical protein